MLAVEKFIDENKNRGKSLCGNSIEVREEPSSAGEKHRENFSCQ
jgi:hypothetical protein